MPTDDAKTSKFRIPTALVQTSEHLKQADTLCSDSPEYQRELLDAAYDGDNHRVDVILADARVDINLWYEDQTGRGKYPALHLASLRGHTATVQLLLARGANVNQQADFQQTALHLACYNNHAPVVQLLLQAGADPELVNNAGWTPIFWTSACNCPEALVQLMLADVNIHAATPEGWTPLHKACEGGHTAIVKALLRAGARDNALTMHGEEPLNIGLSRGHKKGLQPLFEKAKHHREKREQQQKAARAAEGHIVSSALLKLRKKTWVVADTVKRKVVEDTLRGTDAKDKCSSATQVALRHAADQVAERAWRAQRMAKRRSPARLAGSFDWGHLADFATGLGLDHGLHHHRCSAQDAASSM